MRTVAELGKTLGVLLGLWTVLGVVGWVAGAFPEMTGPTAPTPTDGGLGASDGGAAEDAGLAEAPDAWTEAPDAPVLPEITELDVVSICAAPADVVWALGDLTGSADPELVVACDGAVEVLSLAERSLVRFVRVSLRVGTHVRAMEIGDVDADERADLVLSLDDGLYVITRDAAGGFAAPRALAPGANGPVALASLDAEPGLDLAVVHGADPRPELWLYRGGPAPVRATALPAPVSGAAIAVLDLDSDGHLDVVVAGAQQVLLAFGDSRAGVARTRSLTPGGRTIAVLERDAALVIGGEGGACALRPDPAMGDTAACVTIDDLGGAVRDLRVGSDGTLVFVRTPDVVAWTPATGTSTLATLATATFGAHRATVVSQDLLILGSSPREDGSRALELVRAPRGTTFREGQRVEVIDAPLVLALTLPDPDAP